LSSANEKDNVDKPLSTTGLADSDSADYDFENPGKPEVSGPEVRFGEIVTDLPRSPFLDPETKG
jgi:hypothetical protein